MTHSKPRFIALAVLAAALVHPGIGYGAQKAARRTNTSHAKAAAAAPASAAPSGPATTTATAATSDREEPDGAFVQGPPPAPSTQTADPAAAPQDPAVPPAPKIPEPRKAPVPEARVGVDESNPLTMSLTDAVSMALTRNNDIEVERINTEQAGFDFEAARGVYDPILHSLDFYQKGISPVASALGGGANGKLETSTLSNDVTLRKAFRHGGFLDVGATSVRTDTNNLFSSINPSWQTGLTLTFRQPVLRGFSIDDNRRRLRIAQIRLDQSDAAFRQRVIETIGAVQRGYWDLQYALKNVQVATESVSLAETQLARLRRLVQEGINAPVDVVQVEAELERRRENVYTALEGVTTAENTLKALVLSDRQNGEWNRPIIPTDSASVSPVTYQLTDAVSTAIANRPELAQLRAQSEINDVDVQYYRDLKKPQLDLFGTYGLTGLAGTQVTGGNPFTASNAALATRVNEISQQLGLDPLPPPTSSSIPGSLLGGEGRSIANLFSNDYRTYRFGVELSLPIGNRTAEANFGRATAEGRKIEAEQRTLEQRVEREVRNALQSVQTARQRVDAARAAREAAEVQLASEQRRYESGLSTTFLILTRQNDLSDSRARELRALTDYNKAVVELQRVLGTTLTAASVDVKNVQKETPGER
jgi:HAE1 family hydrophobic/amphiphilic exporter-1